MKGVRHATTILLLLLVPAGRPGSAVEPPQAADGAVLSLRTTPIRSDLENRMRSWHAAYRRQMKPVLSDWERVAVAARPGPSETLVAGCRRLRRSLDRLDRRSLLRAPDRAAALHLGRILRALAEAADSCTHGAYFLTTWRLDLAAQAWDDLQRRLGVYQLEPL